MDWHKQVFIFKKKKKMVFLGAGSGKGRKGSSLTAGSRVKGKRLFLVFVIKTKQAS